MSEADPLLGDAVRVEELRLKRALSTLLTSTMTRSSTMRSSSILAQRVVPCSTPGDVSDARSGRPSIEELDTHRALVCLFQQTRAEGTVHH